MLGLLAILGCFDVCAAAMAYLITYDEMERHMPSRAACRAESLRRAAVAFAFFAVGSVLVSLLVLR
jgi:hypothetical protein